MEKKHEEKLSIEEIKESPINFKTELAQTKEKTSETHNAEKTEIKESSENSKVELVQTDKSTSKVHNVEKEEKLEIIVVICLALAALLSAWAAWAGALHGGNEYESHLAYNNLSLQASELQSIAVIEMYQDMALQKEIDLMVMEYLIAETDEEAFISACKIARSVYIFNYDLFAEEVMLWDQEAFDRASEEELDSKMIECTLAYIDEWIERYSADKEARYQEGQTSVTEIESFYYAQANEVLQEASENYEQGNNSGNYSDKYDFVTLILSVVLFLLGIVGVFHKYKNKLYITATSIVILIIAVIYMLTIPMP